jgi:hypothetical protein
LVSVLNEEHRPRTKEECCLLGSIAVRLIKEPHGVTFQKTAFFIVTAVKTSNLT